VTKLFNAYRILAFTVGVLLLIGVVSVLLTGSIESLTLYTVSEDSTAYKIGHPLGLVWILHGWFYIAYLVVAFLLSRRAGWSMTYFVVMLLAGLVPVLMFFVEHLVARRFRREHPDAV
jgi:integral membrane protein